MRKLCSVHGISPLHLPSCPCSDLLPSTKILSFKNCPTEFCVLILPIKCSDRWRFHWKQGRCSHPALLIFTGITEATKSVLGVVQQQMLLALRGKSCYLRDKHQKEDSRAGYSIWIVISNFCLHTLYLKFIVLMAFRISYEQTNLALFPCHAALLILGNTRC